MIKNIQLPVFIYLIIYFSSAYNNDSPIPKSILKRRFQEFARGEGTPQWFNYCKTPVLIHSILEIKENYINVSPEYIASQFKKNKFNKHDIYDIYLTVQNNFNTCSRSLFELSSQISNKKKQKIFVIKNKIESKLPLDYDEEKKWYEYSHVFCMELILNYIEEHYENILKKYDIVVKNKKQYQSPKSIMPFSPFTLTPSTMSKENSDKGESDSEDLLNSSFTLEGFSQMSLSSPQKNLKSSFARLSIQSNKQDENKLNTTTTKQALLMEESLDFK